MSKKEKLDQLTAEELETVQKLNQQFVQTKIALADAVAQQAALVEALKDVQSAFKAEEKKLADKYGKNATVDMRTGEVKQPEEEK